MDKQMELLFNNKEQLFQYLENQTECMIIIDNLGDIAFFNEIAKKMFGFDYRESKFKSIHILIPNYQHIKQQDKKMSKSYIAIKNDIQFVLVKIESAFITIEEELYEVLQLKQVHEGVDPQLEKMNQKMEDIKSAIDLTMSISITDSEGIITMVNDRFCDITKYNREEVIGKTHQILNSGYHTKDFFREMWEKIASGEIWRGEIRNKAKDGSIYWIDTTIVPNIDEDGKPYQYISVQTDVTKKKQMEMDLQEAIKANFIDTMKNLENGIFKLHKDLDGKMIYSMAEGKLLDEIGASSATLLNKTPFEVFPPEIATMKYKSYEQAFEGNRINYELELNGKLVYVDASPIKQGNEITEIVGTVTDVSELRTAQRELKINQIQYQSLVNYSNEYIITLDKECRILYMNPKTMELLNFTSDMFGKVTVVEGFNETDKSIIRNYFEKAIQGEVQFFEFEIKHIPEKNRYLSITLLPIFIDNQIEGVYSIGKDITEQKKIQETNAYLAHHDELTKLPNRRWIEQKIREALVYSQQTGNELAVLFIDLDRFKSINDTLGHFVGDQLLAHIAERIRENIENDKQFAARMGGDEFMILWPMIHSVEEVVLFTENLLESLSTPICVEGYELFTTASIGISIYPSDGNNEVELLKKADIALYKSKELGRNMYSIYDASMNKSNDQFFFLERDLRKAVINNEFIAYFQPRVNIKTGKTIGAEALIRWQHPEIGLVSPRDFIPLAEESGLIIPIGKWMKRKVCEQLVAWREANKPMIPISVNISSQRFLQTNFSKEIRALLTEYQIEGKWLEIEVTENSIMRNEEIVLQTLSELKEMGVKVYIDDFGTGYSSFNYLKTFQLDGVKIDRSFIQNISSHSENAGITTAMIKMAQHLKLEVIAEGVETKEELDYLIEQNCTYIQGYYFGKPCPIEEFEREFLLN